MTTRTQLRIGLGLLGFALLVPLGWGGLQVKKAAASDPEFCISCHQMDEPYERWSMSAHRDVTCVTCHPGSLASDLRHAWRGLVLGQHQVESRAEVDDGACRACHVEGSRDWPAIAATAGHRVHVDGQDLPCVDCHAGALHVERPGTELCVGCHDEELALIGMVGRVHCLGCHPYLADTKPLVPEAGTCSGCHPRSDGHAQADCIACHAPHDRATSADCSGCHEDHASLHPVDLPCASCHAPHRPAADARDRCTDCHRRPSHGENLACSACHASHGVPTSPPTCTSCHPQRAGLHSLSGHQVCASCHPTHRLTAPGPDQCHACHAEVFEEHASTGCTGCHRFSGPRTPR